MKAWVGMKVATVTKGVLRFVLHHSSETSRFYIEAAGVDVPRLLAELGEGPKSVLKPDLSRVKTPA